MFRGAFGKPSKITLFIRTFMLLRYLAIEFFMFGLDVKRTQNIFANVHDYLFRKCRVAKWNS